VITPLVCGIAQVGIDHQTFLGDTLAEIAGEKAGIAKAGVPLICLAQPPEALTAIETVAAKAQAPLLLEGRDWQINHTLKPSMPGAHQVRNANLAAQMAQSIGIDNDVIQRGIRDAYWPARLQKLNVGPFVSEKSVWIDGAHNPAAALELAKALESDPRHLILGILANKDADGIIAPLVPHALSMTFVEVPDHASHDPAALAQKWGGRIAANLPEALANLDDNILIVGSLYLAGVALKLNNELPD
jgi:dihydrofolate synthase / folylpolyglutamate synthase